MDFRVLASGSSANVSLLVVRGFGVLLDFGLGPRVLARRLADAAASWDQVHAVLLTHLHRDHWNANTLRHMGRRGIPLYCHAHHAAELHSQSEAFTDLDDGLVRFYDPCRDLVLGPDLRCRPLPLQHDGGMTCGFRFEGPGDDPGQSTALAYAADLGSWDEALADQLAHVDLLALEFNHDEDMEKNSGRSRQLIERVLGEHGHLSNHQAAKLLGAVLERSEPGRLRHLVQLHLSRQCNRPDLAQAEARRVLRQSEVEVHTAEQDVASPWFRLGGGGRVGPGASRYGAQQTLAYADQQPWLPGWKHHDMWPADQTD